MTVPYDAIADWYEDTFLPTQTVDDPLELELLVREILGPGSGPCLEVLDAGLVPERFAEGGRPTPVVLALRARKP